MKHLRKYRNAYFYVGTIVVFSALIYMFMLQGNTLESGRNIIVPHSNGSQWQEFLLGLTHNLEHPLAVLLAQIVVIIMIVRVFGWIFTKIGQPTVIGEIAAGIVLGPSLFGMYFPEFSAALFPVESLGNLQFLSQIGLILFMFVVGMELDIRVLRNNIKPALLLSHTSIVIPFSLGIVFSIFFYQSFAPEGTPFMSFALFLGVAMSIAAFPVMARIIQERGIHKTPLGPKIITFAAVDDITAWSLLAVVIAVVKAGSFVSALFTISLSMIYVFSMLKIVRPFLQRVGDIYSSRENLSKPIVAIFILVLILSAYATELIGIHALFGAFMAGVIMPENEKFRNIFVEKIEDISLVLLLPLFFVFTGLRTQIGLLDDIYLWKITGLIVALAVVGKFFGSAIAAKFLGETWKDSLTIGALMNTRGLMELVVLNIGYDLGILSPEIFAMMVIMALSTTFMTAPVLNLINRVFRSQTVQNQEPKIINKFKVLISFGNPASGRPLLRIADALLNRYNSGDVVTAMHLTSSYEINQFNAHEYEQESFVPVIAESKVLNRKITTLYKASTDFDSDIAEIANGGNYDLLLLGAGQSIYEGSFLGRILGFTTRIISPDRLLGQVTGKENLFETSPFDERVRNILVRTEIPVGILIDNGLQTIDKIFVPILSDSDEQILKFVERFASAPNIHIDMLDTAGRLNIETLFNMKQRFPNILTILPKDTKTEAVISNYNLLAISLEAWKKTIETKPEWLTAIPSTVVFVCR